jgi:hypothetical protein
MVWAEPNIPEIKNKPKSNRFNILQNYDVNDLLNNRQKNFTKNEMLMTPSQKCSKDQTSTAFASIFATS